MNAAAESLEPLRDRCTAFDGDRRLAAGPLREVAVAVKRALDAGPAGPVLIFDDGTGRVVDIDTRGSEADVAARVSPVAPSASPVAPDVPRGRGRPKLGVVAREVTLLPRHWDWLNAQPGGASVALRKLVEEARRANGDRDRQRRAHEAAYRFMSALAGNLPGFEEAARALFAADRVRFAEYAAAWPPDIRDHAVELAFADRN
jgi:hypothetical protein